MIFIWLILCFYASLVLLLCVGLLKTRKINDPKQVFVSVIVAARNEEQNLLNLINSFKNQTYQNFELIVVNDRSTDKTLEILEALQKSFSKLKVVSVTEVLIAPKKNALTLGISQAKGEILFFTDADCFPQKNWIEKTLAYFSKNTGLVVGFSPVKNDVFSLKSLLFELDSLSLACVSAGTIGLGFPMTCTGRNLAYRKEVFDEVGGFSKIANFVSGDDDLFLHLVRDLTKWEIVFCTESFVGTNPPKTLKAFVNQRLRHASKSKSYNFKSILVLLCVYVLNLWLFLFPLFYFANLVSLENFLSVLLVKSLVEFLVVFWGIWVYKNWKLLLIFPLLEVLHVPYVVILGFLGQFASFDWKQQGFKAKI
ncbi:glycosyltransferase [bacterium]|nr:glycosyltransferase [bacterium]